MAVNNGTTLVDYEKHFSEEAKARHPPLLQGIVNRLSLMKDVIGLHGGLPPASAFPVVSTTLGLQAGDSILIDDKQKMATAQQYSLHPMGYPPLQAWATNITQRLHKPPSPATVKCLITNGATQSIELSLGLLLNRGDPVLVEEFTWPHTLEAICIPRGYQPISVAMDTGGLDPQALRSTLQGFVGQARRPRVLYACAPSAQNPTSVVLSLQRRKEIYEVCREFDVIIVEDDCYFWLQWPQGSSQVPGTQLEGGFLSLDTDGRVVRIDTLAKLLGPGYRLGWITAHPAFIEKACLALSASTIGANSYTQVLVSELLQHWGEAGFESYLKQLQQRYAKNAEAAHEAAQEHLAGVAEWIAPMGGMFMWIKLKGVKDTYTLVDQMLEEKVGAVPGAVFWSRRITHPNDCASPYIRISFISADEAQVRIGIERIGRVVRAASESAAAAASAINGNGLAEDGLVPAMVA